MFGLCLVLHHTQVHFHSDIIYTDNPTIVQSGRTILADLDKLNLDVFQTTQNLDQALAQIEGCQAEMQTIRQRIVHEEQQLRNILSPLHQTGDSEKHEQVSGVVFRFGASLIFEDHHQISHFLDHDFITLASLTKSKYTHKHHR